MADRSVAGAALFRKAVAGRFVMQAGWAFPAGVVRFFRCPKGSRLAGTRLGCCGSRVFLGCVGAELFRSFRLDVKRLRPEEPSYRLGVGMREEYGGECRFRSDRASPVPNGAGPSGSGAATGESE